MNLGCERGENKKKLSVVCTASYDFVGKQWNCRISVTDGDDWVMALWKEFTLENWKELINIYNSLDYIFSDYLTSLGFE